MRKDEIIVLAQNYQDKFSSTLANINEDITDILLFLKRWNQNFTSLRRLNPRLFHRVTSLERQCWTINQYTWRECLEITGFPKAIENRELERTIFRKFLKNLISILANKEDCHCIKAHDLELFHDGGRYHIETSLFICRANQWTGFYMITAFVMKEFKDNYWILKTQRYE